MPQLRELHGTRTFPLGPKLTLLGRHPGCDIVVGAANVSGRHALILHTDQGYWLEDLQSRNGTFLNGRRVTGLTRLSSGDAIELPGLSVRFEEDAAAKAAGHGGASDMTLRQPDLERGSKILSSIEIAGGLRPAVAPEAKLRAILEISRTLGHALSLSEILPKILESLFAVFPQAERGFVLLRNPETGQLVPEATRFRGACTDSAAPSRTIVDRALAIGSALLSSDATIDERFDTSESIRDACLRSVMCVPLLSPSAAVNGLGAIQIDTTDDRHPFVQEDLDVLLCASSQAARAVEMAYQHREQRELEAANRIQQSFLPAERPHIPGYQFFHHYTAARHIGGDYFDYIPLPGDRLAVALGDVSGSGVSAALLMARLSADTRFCLATANDVSEAVRQLNRSLTRTLPDDRFVTFVVAVLNLKASTLTIVNAGHPPPLRVQFGRVDVVGAEAAGLPLAGIDQPYEETTVPFAPGDRWVLYTDGITEARSPTGELYGLDRLRAVIATAPANADGMGDAILNDVRVFSSTPSPRDDLTLLCLSRETE